MAGSLLSEQPTGQKLQKKVPQHFPLLVRLMTASQISGPVKFVKVVEFSQ